MTTPNIAAAGDALMASLAPSLPTPLEVELSDKLSAARRQIEAGLAVAQYRLCVLLAVALMPVALPLSRWLQRREARRGGIGR